MTTMTLSMTAKLQNTQLLQTVKDQKNWYSQNTFTEQGWILFSFQNIPFELRLLKTNDLHRVKTVNRNVKRGIFCANPGHILMNKLQKMLGKPLWNYSISSIRS